MDSSVPIVLQFALATLLPPLAAAVITLLERTTSWGRVEYWPRQVAYGLIFGVIAVLGTEFGIVTHDATMNVRDAAPLVAGLYFGGPAGIIAGAIGGIERWFAALWGRGMFTRVACSTATILAGLYAAMLRKHLLDGRRPGWPLALAIGIVAEVLHMLLVLLTNLGDTAHAFLVVRACTFPMVGCNALSVALAGAVLSLMDGRSLRRDADAPDISHKIQVGMLGVVAVGFAATVGFVSTLQASLTDADARDTLTVALEDTVADVRDASDANLLALAQRVAHAIPEVGSASKDEIDRLMADLDLTEINVVDKDGIIVASNDDVYLGYDMDAGDQSAEFLVLLPGGTARQVVQNYQPISMDESVWRKYAGVSVEDGFVEVGYDAERFIGDLTDEVSAAVANKRVGHGGELLVLTERGALVAAQTDAELGAADVAALTSATERAEEGAMFDASVRGIDYLGMYSSAEGLRVVALLPASEAQMGKELSVLVTSFMEVVVFAALFLAIYVLVKRVVVRSIWQVNGRLGQITAGDLTVEVDVCDSAEFASLSNDINGTVSALRDAIAAEGARIERDLATAKAIQESALPRSFPPFPDIDRFDLFASMNAAREVGGDFYDFFLVDDHTLGFLIADVSGKGIPAALFMMAAKSELANYMKSGMDLAEAVQSANWNLCQGNDAGMFVTVWAATLDFDSGELTYVNAGHNPPLLRHDGIWEWLTQRGGLFLGTFDTAKYRSATLMLRPHDEILLYTDGVNEAFSADEEEYGNDRLEALLAEHNNLHPRLLVDVVRADVRSWSKGAEQSDDITMVCLEYGTPPEVLGSVTVPATDDGFDELMRRIHFELSNMQCPDEAQAQLDLVIEEVFAGICEHAYADAADTGKVELAYVFDANPASVTISVTDWGRPFDPTPYDGPARSMGDDEEIDMGIALAFGNVDDFAYVRDGQSNVVAFRKAW